MLHGFRKENPERRGRVLTRGLLQTPSESASRPRTSALPSERPLTPPPSASGSSANPDVRPWPPPSPPCAAGPSVMHLQGGANSNASSNSVDPWRGRAPNCSALQRPHLENGHSYSISLRESSEDEETGTAGTYCSRFGLRRPQKELIAS